MDTIDAVYEQRLHLNAVLTDNRNISDGVAARLRSKARSFGDTGNQEMYHFLTDIALEMETRADFILAAYSDLIAIEGRDTAQQITRVIETALKI